MEAPKKSVPAFATACKLNRCRELTCGRILKTHVFQRLQMRFIRMHDGSFQGGTPCGRAFAIDRTF